MVNRQSYSKFEKLLNLKILKLIKFKYKERTIAHKYQNIILKNPKFIFVF